MTQQIQCSCGAAVEVDNSTGADTTSCPVCGQPLFVPAPGADEPGTLHRDALELGRLIRRRAFEPIPLAELYRQFPLSRTHLATLFKREFGMTPTQYRQSLRLRRARSLLTSGQMNVSETAYACGFTDPQYFSRAFRQEFGRPPSGFIRRR